MTSIDKTIPLYFDFVSPYAWLALMGSDALARRSGFAWRMRPVVYAALLDREGRVGPAETPASRRYVLEDVARCARSAGWRLEGPPAHPLRTVEALRTASLFQDDRAGAALAVELSDRCWGRGEDLTDPAVRAAAVRACGLDAADLEARIRAPEIKDRLRANTDEAIAAGVFGVPTAILDGELFWGQDRMAFLEQRLAGEPRVPGAKVRRMLDRPRGTDRRNAPGGRR